MKSFGYVAVVVAIAVIGCVQDEHPELDVDRAVLASGGGQGAQVQDLFYMPELTDDVHPSTAVLLRRSDSIFVNVTTKHLNPNEPTTLWFCGLNDPSLCTGACGLADLSPSNANSFCQWGGDGKVSSGGGTVHLSNTINENQPSGSGPAQVLFGAFTDAENADVIFILMQHGPIIPDRLDEQLSTYFGGCPPNACPEPQGTIFRGP